MSQRAPFDDYEVKELSGAGHWRNAFDSRYLRHFWLEGKPRVVTITNVQELVSKNSRSGESKKQLLITLAEADKPWASNVTNCDLIEMVLGTANPKEWIGKRIELYPTKTRFGGEMVDCMRVRDRLPEQPRQRQERTEKPKRSLKVSAYLARMAAAKERADLLPIATDFANDSELTKEETAELLEWFDKRKGQLSPSEETAQ